MDKHNSIKIFLVIAGFIVIFTGSAFMGFKTSGSPGGYSGSPLDGKNCTTCHGGTPTTQAGIITSNIDSSGYVPGSNYTITVSVTGTGLKGFEVSPLNSANQKAGILTAGFESKLTNSNKSVTHSITAGSDPSVWTFQWIAPVIGTGVVTFYGAFTAGKSHTLLSTMVVKEKILSSIVSDKSNHINIWYEAANKKLYFETITINPQPFWASIYSLDGKEIIRIPKKELANGRNKWETDVSGSEKPGVLILKYFMGNSSGIKKIFIY